MLGHKRSKSLLCETGILPALHPWAAASVSTQDSELQHRIQLETYQRDPRKAAAAKRLAEQEVLRCPLPPALIVSSPDDEDISKGRRRSVQFGRYHYYYLSLRAHAQRIRLASLLVLVMICLVCALRLSAMAPHPTALDQWNAPVHSASVLAEKAKAKPQVPTPPPATHSRVRLSQADRNRAAHLGKELHLVKNGLLHVNMDSTTHPIRQLIKDAQAKWEAKNAKQSKTLSQAVAEYKRRYRQAPPKGFDKWWAYTQEHNVTLPDEYDQIARDLAPFRAYSSHDLRSRLDASSRKPATFTLQVTNGELTSSTSEARAAGRLQGQVNLAQTIAKYLPDMTMVYSMHDTPHSLVGFNHRSDLMEAADGDEYINTDDELDTSLRGLSAACASSSALRRGTVIPKSGKTFISDLHAYTDLCENPALSKIHGSLIGKNPEVTGLSPVFSLSKTSLHADVLGVPTEQWVDIQSVPAWEDRKHDKLMWRGSNTGMHFSSKHDWESSQRTRLVRSANAQTDQTITTLSPGSNGKSLSDSLVSRSVKDVNANMDIAFVGKPIQCDADVCPALAEKHTWAPSRMNHSEALDYKYVLDVDGNAWSARFERLLQSGSLIFKSTIMPEWWSDRIQPWVHFVPVQVDYSDMHDILTFFRPDNTDAGSGAEDALASQIASEGREWAKTHWRREDMIAYVFRLYLEWGRLVAPDRDGMNFVYSADME